MIEYYTALRRSRATFGTESESIVAWTEYFFSVLLEQAKQATQLLSKEEIERLLSPQRLKVWNYIDTAAEATPGSIAKATSIARRTVSQALNQLLSMKKVERPGDGRW